jgi:hypothetical protein
MNRNLGHIPIRNIPEHMNHSYNESAYITLQPYNRMIPIVIYLGRYVFSKASSTSRPTDRPSTHVPSSRCRRYIAVTK